MDNFGIILLIYQVFSTFLYRVRSEWGRWGVGDSDSVPCGQCVDWLNVSNKLRAMSLGLRSLGPFGPPCSWIRCESGCTNGSRWHLLSQGTLEWMTYLA